MLASFWQKTGEGCDGGVVVVWWLWELGVGGYAMGCPAGLVATHLEELDTCLSEEPGDQGTKRKKRGWQGILLKYSRGARALQRMMTLGLEFQQYTNLVVIGDQETQQTERKEREELLCVCVGV